MTPSNAVSSIVKRFADALSIKTAASGEIRSDIEIMQSRIREARSEKLRVQNAPVDEATASARVAELVKTLASTVQQHLGARVMGVDFRVGDAAADMRSNTLHGHVVAERISLHLARTSSWELMAAIEPDKLTDYLMQSYRRESNGSEALAPSDRLAKLEALEAEIDDLEAAEEKLIRTAEANGLIVTRRDDANPRWLLALDRDL